ncbi:MAG: alpha/beta hydrolase [Sphingobacteriales bacterium]
MKKLFRILLKTVLVLFILLNIIVAFHAYKFTHFYNDGEVEVKKPEEQTTWDKTKSILFGIDFVKSRNLVAPDNAYEVVKLKTGGDLQLEGWYLKKDSAIGTVIMFHGHGSSKSKILHEASYMESLGYNIMLIDFRGHGGSDGNTCTIGMDEAEDVKLTYDFIGSKGEKNIILWGISLGAATITHSISEYKLQPSKVILEMPFGSLLQAVKGRMKIMGLPPQPASSLLTFWGGVEHGFWAFNLNPCDYVKTISCPVLLEWGAKDARVTKEEIDCIYQNLHSVQKKLAVYQTAKHESLCDKEPEKWKAEIKSFLLN